MPDDATSPRSPATPRSSSACSIWPPIMKPRPTSIATSGEANGAHHALDAGDGARKLK